MNRVKGKIIANTQKRRLQCYVRNDEYWYNTIKLGEFILSR
jgi:hypothetical protein